MKIKDIRIYLKFAVTGYAKLQPFSALKRLTREADLQVSKLKIEGES